jgi:hypothetical protein
MRARYVTFKQMMLLMILVLLYVVSVYQRRFFTIMQGTETTPTIETTNTNNALRLGHSKNNNTMEEKNDQADTSSIMRKESSSQNPPSYGIIRQYSYTNPWILQNGCSMTVAILDPALSSFVYAALESVAENVHPIQETCIIIQTSLCRIQKQYGLVEDSSTFDEAYKLLTESIYNASRPAFRRMIDMGNIRVTIFNHVKYQTTSCDDYRSVNAPFFNIDFWSDYYYVDPDGNKVTLTNNDTSTILTGTDMNPQIQVGGGATNQPIQLVGEFLANQDSDFIFLLQDGTYTKRKIWTHLYSRLFQLFSSKTLSLSCVTRIG